MKKTTLLIALAFATGFSVGLARADEAKPDAAQPFGDWVLRCHKINDSEPGCVLHQKMMSTETKLPVAAFAIARNKESHNLRLAVVLPLGLDIPAGVSGKAGATAIPFTIQTCVRRGCIASTQVDDKLLETLHGADTFTTTFKMRAVTDPTTLIVSLKGLDEGLKALESGK